MRDLTQEKENMFESLAKLHDISEEYWIAVTNSVLMYTTSLESQNNFLKIELEKTKVKLAKIEYSRHKK